MINKKVVLAISLASLVVLTGCGIPRPPECVESAGEWIDAGIVTGVSYYSSGYMGTDYTTEIKTDKSSYTLTNEYYDYYHDNVAVGKTLYIKKKQNSCSSSHQKCYYQEGFINLCIPYN